MDKSSRRMKTTSLFAIIGVYQTLGRNGALVDNTLPSISKMFAPPLDGQFGKQTH